MKGAISRRDLLKGGAVAAGLTALGSPALGMGESDDERPNVLLIITDQQSCWTLGAYGGNLIPTPHIDSLARDGATFVNFFANSAICTPSRGCLLTGRYPHVHGADQNDVEMNRDEVTFGHVAQRQGYETGYAGKWHLDGASKPGWIRPERSMGFTDCRYMFNRGHCKKIVERPQGDPDVFAPDVIGDERTYPTDWLCDKAIEFISRPRRGPFCYVVGILDPHTPYSVRAPYDAMFKPEDMPLPATLRERNLPRWAEATTNRAPGTKQFRRLKAQYCGEVKCIDDNVGRILSCLRTRGILDNTIVVFTSDHGEYMGEHTLMGKNKLYEPAHRIPLLIRWPKRIAPGTRVERIVCTVDFQQTLCGLMGIRPSGREQGRDACPLLRGEQVDWVDEALIHHSTHERAGIFTPEFELAYVKDSDHILFDRKNDPDQANNLFGQQTYKRVIDELTTRIIRHHTRLGSPAARWLKTLQV